MITRLRILGSVFLVFLSVLPAGAAIGPSSVMEEDQTFKAVPLPDLVNPTGIHIAGGRIFITEESSIAVYSAENFKLLKKFGRQGEGPGEFKHPPFVIPQSDCLLILNLDRVFLYSWEGELLEERKIPLNYNYWAFPLLPVGNNWIGFPMEPIEGGGFGHIGRLYNDNFQSITKVYDAVPSLFPPPPPPRRPGETSRSFPKQDLEAIPDCIDVFVAEDKFLVTDTRKGFFISAFDAQGNKLYEINRDFKKTRVSKDYRDAYMEELHEHPNWEGLNNRYNHVFKDHFPAFFSVKVAGKKIYCLTYEKKNDRYEMVVLDLEGKLLGRFFSFPLEPFQRLNDTFIQFSNEFDIHSDTIYHLEYNFDLESVELHVTAIK